MDKKRFTYNEILLSHYKRWNLATSNNMDGPGGYYAKWNELEGGRQILYDFSHTLYIGYKKLINKRNKVNEQTKSN